MAPHRIVQWRTAGWRKPVNCRCTGTPKPFGNPFREADFGRTEVAALHRQWLDGSHIGANILASVGLAAGASALRRRTNVEPFIRARNNRKARLYPALLVALPAFTLFAWFPALRTFGPGFIALLGLCGSILWLSCLARDRGKAVEAQLYASWNGMPSVAMLRHRDKCLPGPLKARYKAFLQEQLPDRLFPSEADEQRDLAAADAVYALAVAWLQGHTRDGTRFALLFEENINYAFRRNFWALKPIALTVAACSLSNSLGNMAAEYARIGADPTIAVATGLVALYALFIVIRVNRDWVKLAAEAHAQQLLAACIREGEWLADSPPGRDGAFCRPCPSTWCKSCG